MNYFTQRRLRTERPSLPLILCRMWQRTFCSNTWPRSRWSVTRVNVDLSPREWISLSVPPGSATTDVSVARTAEVQGDALHRMLSIEGGYIFRCAQGDLPCPLLSFRSESVLAGCLSDNLRRISRYFKGGFHGAVSSLCNWRMPTRSTRQRRFIRPASFRGVSLERRDSMSTNLGRGSEESNHGMPRADSGRPVDSFSWVGLPT